MGSMRTTITRHLQQSQNREQQGNPFLAPAATSTTSNQNDSQNPFLGSGKEMLTSATASSALSQLAPPNSSQQQQQQASINPFLSSRPVASVSSSSQPPSCASIVSGGGGEAQTVRQQPPGPIPTFITHGPNSVQVLSEPGHSDVNAVPPTMTMNQFISAPSSSLQSSQLPVSTSTLLGPPNFQIPVNIGVPQIALSTQGGTLQAPPIAPPPPPPPPSQLPSYDQATVSNRPAMQMAAATIGPPQGGAGALPTNMTLHVKGVPDELNNQAFIEKHFSRFGPLKAVECRPQKKYATVTFRNKVYM